MEKASKAFRFVLAAAAMVLILMCAMGCQRTISSQDAPVTTQQATIGQPYIFQIQLFTAQSENARPIHARAAEAGGAPTGLGKNWAEYADFSDANISITINVNGQADTATESIGEPSTGSVDQSPKQDNKLAIPVAVGANPTANASVADEATGDTTTGDRNPSPPAPPTPPADPTTDPVEEPDPVSLHTLEDIMLAHLERHRRR